MGYVDAVKTLLDGNVVAIGLTLAIAVAVLLGLAANAKEAWRKLFGNRNPDGSIQQHIVESEERFKRGEKHIAENHDHIADLREGQRVCCLSLIALLGHELHNGNKDEMESALRELNSYLINRK